MFPEFFKLKKSKYIVVYSICSFKKLGCWKILHASNIQYKMLKKVGK